jgi:hypothetical protein
MATMIVIAQMMIVVAQMTAVMHRWWLMMQLRQGEWLWTGLFLTRTGEPLWRLSAVARIRHTGGNLDENCPANNFLVLKVFVVILLWIL